MGAEIDRLKEIVETLRSENGCPWDKAQTHDSLKASCIEEAAEVVSGINILDKTGDPENLKEELGDLLLQVMFHAVMAEEEGYFTFDDVARTINEKMVRRHPHVFSGVTYANDEELHAAWAEIKRKEKAGREWQEEYLAGALDESALLIEKAKERKGYK
ncbi:tetrapyrrole methylase [Butyrivibrio sp. CB08]|uniref:MazG nucleotide pyrophosphohydrolase domain-containing protein n=1 Tax=Butyrivibrio sp. CB08 TaxID=2364879 RepID=UPI000EAA2623|nr:MazG nucleotide pyrophosphohydrolase domain-containing protein [Butyrivibrio sp. CB08]RKM56119.1 tetrapyrrole methylase [Butyrivibrio sp. CB08]